MPDKKIELDKLVNDLKALGFNDPISEGNLEKLIELEEGIGLCDGGCIAISKLPPCDSCCIRRSPA